jgi:DNA (cytosine-5)-methyltransferase 1
MRERMFLIAYRKEIADDVRFPEPTHWISLPAGYDGSRAVALKLLARTDDDFEAGRYRPPPEGKRALPPAVTAEEAIGDLPAIDARRLLASGKLRRGARRFDELVPYNTRGELNAYASMMRTWRGFEGADTLRDHVIRYLPRDYPLFARLRPGDQYPQAYQCAQSMFAEKIAHLERKGEAPRKGSAAWERLRAETVPPYDPGKFPNKWRKMERDRPARTLMAHLGKDSYSHIHYDSTQARTISVREAARLQAFPDGFIFCGTMNPAFRQIGNAVPPLLAKAVATAILAQLRAGIRERAQLKGIAGAA